MSNSEIHNTFDESRAEFKPYGLTCELWSPTLMRRPDRHNEIEINYCAEGEITYLFQGKKITIPQHRLTLFWGLIPHQIVHHDSSYPYYVCTIPFSQFLEWKLPAAFVDSVLKGSIVVDSATNYQSHDLLLLDQWIKDMRMSSDAQIVLLEIHARLRRMASNYIQKRGKDYLPVHSDEISTVENISMYIAQNYKRPMKMVDIGKAVGLHPDYANSIFKKAFGCTLGEYIMEERVAHAQRQLVATDTSITEIAFECGFRSIGRFNAAFQKANQCTPREFRKRYQ